MTQLASAASTKIREPVRRGNGHAEGDPLPWILAKAAQFIARKGYHKVSMRDIAGVTKFSLAGLYHHVHNKEDLLYQIQLRFFSSLVSEQERIHAAREPASERLRALVRNHLDFFTRHTDELRVCTYELESLTGEWYEAVARIRKRYYALVADAVDGVLRDRGQEADERHVRHMTLFLFGSLNWIFMWYDAEKDGPAIALGDELHDMMLGGLCGAPPPAATANPGKQRDAAPVKRATKKR